MRRYREASAINKRRGAMGEKERLEVSKVTKAAGHWYALAESRGHELATLRAERDEAVRQRNEAAGRFLLMSSQHDELLSERDALRQRMDSARGLLAPLGSQPIPSVLAIREALNILRP